MYIHDFFHLQAGERHLNKETNKQTSDEYAQLTTKCPHIATYMHLHVILKLLMYLWLRSKLLQWKLLHET